METTLEQIAASLRIEGKKSRWSSLLSEVRSRHTFLGRLLGDEIVRQRILSKTRKLK